MFFFFTKLKINIMSVTDTVCAISNAPHQEYKYLDLIKNVLQNGIKKNNRTNVETLSLFGTQLRFNIKDEFPLLTTKKIFWKGVVEELLWFISGSTDATILSKKNIHIWDGNGSREFLDSQGFTDRNIGDLGPVYGFQWRHYGAQYRDSHTDYTGLGIDQLSSIITKLKETPNDRRIIMSAWNPADIPIMALPPCHMMAQFYVTPNITTGTQQLSCLMTQRSADVGLGVPFNIASYALLTYMISHLTGYIPNELIINMGDTHIYTNHIPALQEQISRTPMAFPTLHINRKVNSIDDFRYDDFNLTNYVTHPNIKMDMVV